jgi:hypothetical protein
MAKKFFRRAHIGEEGKGSWRRDTQVSEKAFTDNWERIFGHDKEKGAEELVPESAHEEKEGGD